jgi:predicted nucleic acid-binding protein
VKSFFDTSVLVASFLDGHEHYDRSFAVLAGANRTNACCAAHSLAELYATLTRLPGKLGLSADQALLSLDSVAERLELISLDVPEYQHAIRAAASAGIVGGTIYDALLGECAVKARATKIYTWNVSHFRMLSAEIAAKVRTPYA